MVLPFEVLEVYEVWGFWIEEFRIEGFGLGFWGAGLGFGRTGL